MNTDTRRALAILIFAIAAALLGRFTQGPVWLEGLFYDSALAARALLSPAAPSQPRVLVVELDENSLAHPDLAGRPRALFGPVWAKTIMALREAGARVVVLDFILAFSGEAFVPGYDREFLRTLHQNRGGIVLARSQSLLPARSYSAALGFSPAALGLADLAPDNDGVYRNIPLLYGGDDKSPSIAGAALMQAGAASIPETVRLAPDQPTDGIPSMPLSTLLGCARSSPASVARAVGGKIVFVGTGLQEEDRKLSPSRFFPYKSAAETTGASCEFEETSSGAAYIPGVYLYAQAVDQALGRRLLVPLDPWFAALTAGLAAGLAMAAALRFRPAAAITGISGVCAVLWLGEIAALDAGKYAAMGYPALLSAAIGGGGFMIRFLLEERRRALMQSAFGHYLAPELVKQLSEQETMPALGGELREVSVMFADLSGFTALSSRLPAEEVVALTNHYLGLMAEEIEASNGYIDKYIGDAVMAVWGAPLAVQDHAQCAVRCASQIARRIRAAHAGAMERGVDGFSVKIGVNSGMAIAGNVGGHKRLNYTAVGDTVNVAARLESVPGDYGCMIVLGEATAALLNGAIAIRELDRIGVKGREAPLAIFEPLDGMANSGELAQKYAQALALYRKHEFTAAMLLWRKLAQHGDQPSAVMAERARQLQLNPPPLDWDGVWRRTAK